MIGGQVQAIVWAQWRTIVNYSGRSWSGRFPITLIFFVVWYALWAFGAYGVAVVAASPDNVDLLNRALPVTLLFVMLYWQFVPIMMASTGISLDLARLLVYPIAHAQLFSIEVVLRLTTALEMLFVLGGLGIGLLLNPEVPWWGISGLVVFTALNLFLSVGVRDLFTRLMTKKGFREAAILAIVLVAAAPQLLLTGTSSRAWRDLLETGFGGYWPWSATGTIAMGHIDWQAYLLLTFWTVLAYRFGWSQFERSLRSDAAESRGSANGPRRLPYLLDVVLQVPRRVFRDPLAVLIEKELRTLSRSPRFRLLFMMGFSFGLLIWLPLALRGDSESALRNNYLTIVSAYALMLLGEVCFWNSFGMDRTASQIYFVMPVSLRTVLYAKNVVALFFVALEVALVAAFCTILRMPVSASDIAEAFGVTAVLTIFMLAIGNLLAMRYPRPVDPAQSWRSGSMGRVQAFLLLLYPVASMPVFLAYGARYAFDTQFAFYAVLALDVLLGLIVYSVSIDSAVASGIRNKEQFVSALSSSRSPVGS